MDTASLHYDRQFLNFAFWDNIVRTTHANHHIQRFTVDKKDQDSDNLEEDGDYPMTQ